ncbi:MAG: PqiC family protein [Dyella sp.]
MIRLRSLAAATLALMLAACASAPMHYHTLVAPAATPSNVSVGASLPFELLPVHIPVQVDQPQLVVRQGEQGVALLDGERWVAPLADEVHSALSSDLVQALPGQNVNGLPMGSKPVLRITLNLRRFDSLPGDYALIDAAWSLRLSQPVDGATLACTSQIRESVGAGYDALVQGHQQALQRLAEQIGRAARPFAAGQPVSCPGG